MLTYPFRAAVLGWLLGLTLASTVVQAFTGLLRVRWLPRFETTSDSTMAILGVIGILLELLWWMLAFKIAVEALRSAASGCKDGRGREFWIDDEQAARQVLLWGGALLAGYLIYLHLGGVALAVYCLALALVLPAILILLGMEGSLRRALDPRAWQALMQRSGKDYVVVAAKLASLAVLFGIAQVELFWPLSRWLAVPMSRLALLYILFACYHELGRMLEGPRQALEPRNQALGQPEAISPMEELAMRAAERLALENRFARAARELEPLVVARVASTAAHARFRELLALAGDHATLLLHARHYIPMLLAADKQDEALALYHESQAFDPAFELAEADALGQLIEFVAQAQLPLLAITLAQEFLRRFPDEPDAVPHGLVAARLTDRMGRDEEARLLLVTLVRRFPRHPMRGELVAALETLERVARRGR